MTAKEASDLANEWRDPRTISWRAIRILALLREGGWGALATMLESEPVGGDDQ